MQSCMLDDLIEAQIFIDHKLNRHDRVQCNSSKICGADHVQGSLLIELSMMQLFRQTLDLGASGEPQLHLPCRVMRVI